MEIIDLMSSYQTTEWANATGLPSWSMLPALSAVTVLGIALTAFL